MEMYIVLAITLFMMVMFIWNKVPFGVTTMTCCLLLAMFGIVDIPKAFGWIWKQDCCIDRADAGTQCRTWQDQPGYEDQQCAECC